VQWPDLHAVYDRSDPMRIRSALLLDLAALIALLGWPTALTALPFIWAGTAGFMVITGQTIHGSVGLRITAVTLALCAAGLVANAISRCRRSVPTCDRARDTGGRSAAGARTQPD
jgi:hypothetical protein